MDTGFLDELARRLGVPYRLTLLPDGQTAYLIGGVAVLDENLTPERAHWRYCHEVAHLRLNHPDRPPRDEAEEREQENDANRLAAELLLPAEEFRPHAGASLPDLKRAFPFASHEALARRRTCFRPGGLTILDNGRLTLRLAPDGCNLPRRLLPLEDRAYRACLDSRRTVTLNENDWRIEATYVDEGVGVIRVLLFLEGEAFE